MPTIVTFTLNPAVDSSCSVDRVVPEHKLRCSAPEYDPGGGGVNVVRVVRELGGQAKALWTCGGPMGQLLGQLLDRAEIEHQPIPVSGHTRENLTVYEETSTQQYRFGMPGPEMSPEEAERCIAAVREIEPPPDYLVLSGSLPPGCEPDIYARIAGEVAATCRVILDTSGRALKESLKAKLFLIKPNLRELGQLMEREIDSDAEIENAARRLIDSGAVEAVATSLGPGGAVLTTAESSEHIRSPTVPIRSKVGAGDSMVGGIVSRLAQGRPIADAVRFGVATGAATVMTTGTKLCRREDVERLYRQMTNS